MNEQQEQPDDQEQIEETAESDDLDGYVPTAEDYAALQRQLDAEQSEEEPDTFPRAYVEELRQENGRYRQRAQRADDLGLAHRLHTELVRATGRLADANDLPFDEAHLDDPEALATAIDDLLGSKPHLASRRPTGDIGQGPSPSPATVDLAALLRQRAQ